MLEYLCDQQNVDTEVQCTCVCGLQVIYRRHTHTTRVPVPLGVVPGVPSLSPGTGLHTSLSHHRLDAVPVQ